MSTGTQTRVSAETRGYLNQVPAEHLSRTVRVFGHTPLLRQLHDMCDPVMECVHPWGLLGSLLFRTSLIYPKATCLGEPLSLFAGVCGRVGSGKRSTKHAADEIRFGGTSHRNTFASGYTFIEEAEDVAGCIAEYGFCRSQVDSVRGNGFGVTEELGRGWFGHIEAGRKDGDTPPVAGRVAMLVHAYPEREAAWIAGDLLDKFTWWLTDFPADCLRLSEASPQFHDTFADLESSTRVREVSEFFVEEPLADFSAIDIPIFDRNIAELPADLDLPKPTSVRDRNRIRIAALGALLNGQRTVDLGWWLWAEECLLHSDYVLSSVMAPAAAAARFSS